MGWVGTLMRTLHREQEDLVDPDEVALRATLADLRRVSLDMHETNTALTARVEKLRGRSVRTST